MRLAAAVLLACAVSPALAETLTERAQRLFEEGLRLEDAGDERSCDRFAESYRLVAAAGTGFNLAECMEQDGELLRAWQLFTAVAVEWERDDKDKRAAIARERASKLESQLVTLVIELAEPDLDQLRITVGERSIAPAKQIRELADPGAIEVRAVAPGRVPYVSKLDAEAGTTRELRIELEPIAGDPPRIVERHRRRSRIVLAAGLGAVGAAGLVAGTVLFFDARELQAQGDEDRAARKADLATVCGAAGAAFAIGAIVVFATAPRDVTLVPVATRQSAGLAITGMF